MRIRKNELFNGEIMKISRLTQLTLGVGNLDKAMKFYEAVLDIPPNTSYDGVVFFELSGTWISLYPLENLANDISSEAPKHRGGFSGITLAHNTDSKDEVISVIERARSACAPYRKRTARNILGWFQWVFC